MTSTDTTRGGQTTLRIDLRTIRTVLVVVVGSLIVLHYLAVAVEATEPGRGVGRVAGMLNLDEERSVGTLMAVWLLGSAAGLSALLGTRERGSDRRRWMVLASALVFVALDEVTTIHEGLDQVLFEMTGGDAFLTFLWVLPYGIGALALGAVYIPFLRRLPRDVGARIFLGGVIFVAGAVGVEIVGSEVFDRYGFGSTAFYLVAGVEEGLELTGAALAILGLIRHVGAAPLLVTVDPGDGGAAAKTDER